MWTLFRSFSQTLSERPSGEPLGTNFEDPGSQKALQNIAALCRSWARKWFWAITCTIWLRLEFRGRHSAWFFGAHLLFFHAIGWISEPRIGFWIPKSTFWPRDHFGTKKGSRKNLFCGGMILWRGFKEIHPAQMNSMVPGSHMGKLLCPQPPLKNKF